MSSLPGEFVSIIERLARQEVLVAEVRSDVHEGFEKLDSRFAALEVRIAATEDAVRTAKIGWRLLVTIGSIVLALAGTAGALAAKWLHLVSSFSR